MAGIKHFVTASADHLRQAASHYRVPLDELCGHIMGLAMTSDDEDDDQDGGSVEQWNEFRKTHKAEIHKYANDHLISIPEAAKRLYPEKVKDIVGLNRNGTKAERSAGLEQWAEFLHNYQSPDGATGYDRLADAAEAYRVQHPKKDKYRGITRNPDGSIKFANIHTLWVRLIKEVRLQNGLGPATRTELSKIYHDLQTKGKVYQDVQGLINMFVPRTETQVRIKNDAQLILNQIIANDETKRADFIRREHLRGRTTASHEHHPALTTSLAPPPIAETEPLGLGPSIPALAPFHAGTMSGTGFSLS